MNIKLILDIANKDWVIDYSKIDPYDDYIDLYFSFVKDGENNVEFNNLRFGCSITDSEDNMLGSTSYPNDGIQYVQTDQEYLEVFRQFGFRPNREYRIDAWAENGDVSFSETLNIFIPIPHIPYLSWSWNDEIAEWQPPFQPPDDGNMYTWNELEQKWDIYIPEPVAE
jgi:hypothetical protein